MSVTSRLARSASAFPSSVRVLNRDVPGDRFGPPCRRDHDGGQEPRVEPELLIQGDVLGALREGEQAVVRGPPGVELIDGCGKQRLGDAALVQIRTNRDRSEKADAAPSGDEVGTDQVAVDGRAKCADMRRPPAAVNVVAICPEGFRVRDAQKRAECHPEDTFRCRQIALGEGGDHRLGVCVAGRC